MFVAFCMGDRRMRIHRPENVLSSFVEKLQSCYRITFDCVNYLDIINTS